MGVCWRGLQNENGGLGGNALVVDGDWKSIQVAEMAANPGLEGDMLCPFVAMRTKLPREHTKGTLKSAVEILRFWTTHLRSR